MNPAVSVQGLTKTFRGSDSHVRALDDVTFDIEEGEFLVLLGPSGCGKSTLLRCIAGLEAPDSGEITFGGRTVFSASRGINVSAERRHLSMVFQSYALWPHMSVFKNVAYPLESRKVPRRDIAPRVHAALDAVGIGHLSSRLPSQMSGGQQQRVALARAIVAETNLVLFDEPLSNVDAKVREQLRIELVSLQRALGFTAVYVTHDQTEALSLASRIAVMKNRVIAQLGAPRDIYTSPSSRYVGRFVGTANEVLGVIESIGTGRDVTVRTDFGITTSALTSNAAPNWDVGARVHLMFRPERCRISTSPVSGWWQGISRTSLFVGSYTEHLIDVEDQVIRVWSDDVPELPDGTEVWFSVKPEDALVFPFE